MKQLMSLKNTFFTRQRFNNLLSFRVLFHGVYLMILSLEKSNETKALFKTLYNSFRVQSHFRHLCLILSIDVNLFFKTNFTAQTGSVYLTLAVTIERYIAVCHR